MDRLERFVTRRRRLVLGVWVVVLLASLPFAARQTENLTSGGFEVPGSGSVAVSDSLREFPGVQSEPLILALANPGATLAALITVGGIWAVAIGVMRIILSFQVKRLPDEVDKVWSAASANGVKSDEKADDSRLAPAAS